MENEPFHVSIDGGCCIVKSVLNLDQEERDSKEKMSKIMSMPSTVKSLLTIPNLGQCFDRAMVSVWKGSN